MSLMSKELRAANPEGNGDVDLGMCSALLDQSLA